MNYEHLDDSIRWRLLAMLDDAGAGVAKIEAQNSDTEARISRMGAIIARVRSLASEAGIALSEPPTPHGDDLRNMTLAEFAAHVRWGEKRMRKLVREEMSEGEHYHRNGTGRQATYILHVRDAEAFVRRFSVSQTSRRQVDELAQFRAKATLRKRGK